VVLITTTFIIAAAVTGGLLEINVIDGEGLGLRYPASQMGEQPDE